VIGAAGWAAPAPMSDRRGKNGVHLSPRVDYADLDGNLLIANDPYEGVHVERRKLILPESPGLGVRATTAD
jgi:hypothetical protein